MKGIDLSSIKEKGAALSESLRNPENPALKWILAGLLALLLIVLGAQWAYSRWSSSRAEASQQALQAETTSAAAQLGETLRVVGSQLDALTQNPRVLAAASLSGPEAGANRKALGIELSQQFPKALGLRVLPADLDSTDDSAAGPLSYASLDMLQATRRNDRPAPAEVHMPGQAGAQIVLVRGLKDIDGKWLGFLHLSLEPALLTQAMSGYKFSPGYVELQQKVGGATPVLNALGDKGYKQGTPINAPIAGSAWNLAFWPVSAQAPDEGGGGNLLVWGLGILGLGGACLGAVLLGRRAPALKRLMKRKEAPVETVDIEAALDGTVYEGAARALMDGTIDPTLGKLIQSLAKSSARGGDFVDLHAGDDSASRTMPAGMELDENASSSPRPTPVMNKEISLDSVPASIFRAYDIRGVVDETLTEEGVNLIGMAIGSEAQARGQQTVVVGRDGRNSSPRLAQALMEGLMASGRDVIDIGMVPTPVLYFATHYLDTGSGVMLTGSHNPPNYNGLKIMLAGDTLSGDTIMGLRNRIASGQLTGGKGSQHSADMGTEYIRRVSEDIPLSLSKSLSLVVDCGNGVPGALAPQLLRALGHDVRELYCEVDGNFPNHHPDPSQPENLAELIATVKKTKADLGLAFDGDGDRLGVVDSAGNIIWPDRQMMLYSADILSRNPGASIIFDVKCTRRLKAWIKDKGGEPIMWKTGHSLIKAKMKETGALLAGEMSGHIFFKERWYGFDDALYTAARLVEIVVAQDRPSWEIFEGLPGGIATPELRLPMPETEHAGFMQRLIEGADFATGEVSTIDGIRVDFSDGWGLIRPSNTTPYLILRFEGDNERALERVKNEFRTRLLKVDPELSLPF